MTLAAFSRLENLKLKTTSKKLLEIMQSTYQYRKFFITWITISWTIIYYT